MIYTAEKNENYTILKMQVEKLDSHIAPGLKSELVVMNSEGVRNIIMDLSNTRYCDSSGLSSILVANRLCKNSNGKFVITGLQDSVRKLITISQLDTILSIADSTESAIEKIVALEKGHDA